ncbi:MAG: tetratricopeptide repeat protein [Myxococcota bacterium]
MADEKEPKVNEEFAPEIGDPDEQETDILFRAQMGVYNFFVGNWQTLLGILVVFLAGVLVFSLYVDYQRDLQRGWQADIAEITRRMPEPNPLSALTGGEDEQTIATLKEGARRYEAVAKDSQGAASSSAWILAGEAWIRAGDTDAAMSAFQGALANEPAGVMAWSAAAQLATLKANTGDVDAALGLYDQHTAGEGFIAQHALLEKARLLEVSGRSGEAIETLEQFQSRFAESALAPQAADAITRLRG